MAGREDQGQMKLREAKKRVKHEIQRCERLAERIERLEHKLMKAYRKAERAYVTYALAKRS